MAMVVVGIMPGVSRGNSSSARATAAHCFSLQSVCPNICPASHRGSPEGFAEGDDYRVKTIPQRTQRAAVGEDILRPQLRLNFGNTVST